MNPQALIFWCSFSGAAGIVLVFGSVYVLDRSRYLLAWLLGWLALAAHIHVQMLFRFDYPEALFIAQISAALGLVAAALITWGCYSFARERMPRWLAGLAIAALAYSVLGLLLRLPIQAVVHPQQRATAGLALMAAWVIWRMADGDRFSRRLASVGFILWAGFTILKTAYHQFGLGQVVATDAYGALLSVLSAVALFNVYIRRMRFTLQDSLRGYRRLIQNSSFPILVHISGEIVHANDACVTLLAAGSADGLVGRSILDFAAPEEREKTSELLSRYKQLDPVRIQRSRIVDLEGGDHTVTITSLSIDYKGRPARLALLRDLTELEHERAGRREAQQVAEDYSARLEAYFNATTSGICILDSPESRTITDINPALGRLLGYRKDELVGQNAGLLHVSDALYGRFGKEVYAALEKTGAWRGEWPFRHKDGRTVWTDITLSRLPGDGAVAIVNDLTSRRREQQELRRLATAIESSADAKMITDTEGGIQYINAAFEETFSVQRKDAIGRHVYEIIQPLNPDAPVNREIWQTVGQGQPWRGRLVNRAKNGKRMHVDVSVAPIFNETGRVVAFVSSERDVTAEVELGEQYRQAQKMEAIGTLAGGIAHDFNNVLFAIQGYTEMSLDDVGPASRAYGNLQEVLTASRRASELVKQILAFSRQGEQEIQSVQAELIVKEVARLIRAATPAMIQIRTAMPTEPCYVLCDPGQLHQVLMNLCTNARHAMEERGGQLSLAVQKVRFGEDGPAAPGGLEDGDYVRLVVADTGQGIPEVVRDRIFDPFFTTKAVGEGTGLGLAMVHGIVTGSGGSIEVETEMGEGTSFTIHLPAIAEPAGSGG